MNKKIILAFVFAISLFSFVLVSAQEIQTKGDDISYNTTTSDYGNNNSSGNDVDFKELAKANFVAFQSLKLNDVGPGYYVMAETHFTQQEAKEAQNTIKLPNYESGYIYDPKSELYHVYLAKFNNGSQAVNACLDQLGGKTTSSLWVLEVPGKIKEPKVSKRKEKKKAETTTPSEIIVAEEIATLPVKQNADKTLSQVVPDASVKQEIPNSINPKDDLALKDVSYEMLVDADQADTMLKVENKKSKKSFFKGSKSRTLQKADAYFDKMWYAKAAELYEEALSKGGDNYAPEVIQRAGDAYYFNTNMEQAYHWYNKLYDEYGKEMSNDFLFKYAHSLKGIGKYNRAKRLMKLYNKRMNKEDIGISFLTKEVKSAEVVLDEILNSEKQFDAKNLDINTKYSDFGATIIDSSHVIYASAKESKEGKGKKYQWNNQPFLDLYEAHLNLKEGELDSPTPMSKKINTRYHEAAVTFNPDKTVMYFTRNNYGKKKLRRDKKGVNNLKIYMSHKEEGNWSEPVELPFNSDDYSAGHPALSPDGKKLYFISDMPGTIGDTDIFVVDVYDKNSFSEPKNLGPNINTEKKEMFPFINEENLYFASNGRIGLGGLDVYKASYDSEEGFEEPINMGIPINSNKDDFSFVIDQENDFGFFSSNRDGGKGDDDLYSFDKVGDQLIAVLVTEKSTGNTLPNTLIELLDENGIVLEETITKADGSALFDGLVADNKYTVRANHEEFKEEIRTVKAIRNDTVNVPIVMGLDQLVDKITVEDGIKKIKTEMIHFDFDKYYIRKDAGVELDKLVKIMREYPNMVIKIESHTDSRGSREYNRNLSNNRAKSTKDYIISKGIAPNRIQSTTGFGEDRLLNGCDGTIRCSKKQHFLNRRSEFIIVNM